VFGGEHLSQIKAVKQEVSNQMESEMLVSNGGAVKDAGEWNGGRLWRVLYERITAGFRRRLFDKNSNFKLEGKH